MGIELEEIKKLTRGLDKMQIYSDMLKYGKENYILVGIPESKTVRKDEQTNAELLYLHTNGSPINHIPKRPVVEPALEDDADKLTSMLKSAMEEFIVSGESSANKELEKVGVRGQKVTRGWFVNPKNNWPPNSPAVQEAKRKKKATDPKPLIDTGEMRKSITYVVVKDGVRNG